MCEYETLNKIYNVINDCEFSFDPTLCMVKDLLFENKDSVLEVSMTRHSEYKRYKLRTDRTYLPVKPIIG